jgi:predicted dehydrogenase
MVGFRKRYTPAYRRAREIVSSGEFGAPVLFAATRTSGGFAENEADPTTWFLLDMGVHVIDLARFLCGEVASVYAQCHVA